MLKPLLLTLGIETWAAIGASELSMAARVPGVAGLSQVAGLSEARAAIVVAFPYDPRPAPATVEADFAGGTEPYLRVAAFASSHRYAALARLLKLLAKELATATGHPYAGFRVAVNSGLPEKRLAELAGLGCRGRSDLLLSHAYGPACILGLLLLPYDPFGHGEALRGSADQNGYHRMQYCGSCRACADACPGHAIDGSAYCSDSRSQDSGAGCSANSNCLRLPPTYKREACIQHWMSTTEDPPATLLPAFSGRLYGCDACIMACPHSARAWLPDRADASSPASRADALLLPKERRPGALVSAPFITSAEEGELRSFFRKTGLGLSWLGPGVLRRNAVLGCNGSVVSRRLWTVINNPHSL